MMNKLEERLNEYRIKGHRPTLWAPKIEEGKPIVNYDMFVNPDYECRLCDAQLIIKGDDFVGSMTYGICHGGSVRR